MTQRSDRPVREWRFLQLTLFMAAWMLLSPHLGDRWFVQLLMQVFMLNCVLVTLWANPEWGWMRGAMIGLWLVSVAGALLALLISSPEWWRTIHVIENATLIPLLALLAAGILRFAFRSRRLTVDGIFATVAAYVLVALLFAQLYEIVLAFDAGSFNVAAEADRPPQLVQGDLLYFSFVTLATLGYGDVLPLGDTARTLAVIEAVVGQFYVAVIVAVFVGMYSVQRRD